MIFKKFADKLKSLNFVKNYKKIYPYVRPYRWRAVAALLITLPIGSMDAVIAWVLKPYMDTVMIEKSVQATSLIPVLIILFSFLQSMLNYGATYLNTWVGNRITMDLKADLFKKMMRCDPAFFDKKALQTERTARDCAEEKGEYYEKELSENHRNTGTCSADSSRSSGRMRVFLIRKRHHGGGTDSGSGICRIIGGYARSRRGCRLQDPG